MEVQDLLKYWSGEMIDLHKPLTIQKDYKIRKEKFGAILFHRPTLGISKTSNFVFEIYKQIDKNHYSVNELLKLFNIADNDKNNFIVFLSNLLQDGGIEYGNERTVDFQQVFENIDEEMMFQAPNMVWWDITAACNLNCYYCYSASGCKKPDELTYEKTINIIDQLSQIGVFYIYFLGGEPFMKERFLDIINYTYDKAGMGVMITTNGTLINENMKETLEKVSCIRVSLDSANEEIHNKMRRRNFSFKKCNEALKILSDLNINSFGINSTIGPDNYKNLEDLYNLAKSYNCNLIQMIPVCGSGRANEAGNFLSENQRQSVKEQLTALEQKIKANNFKTILDAPEGYIEKYGEEWVYKHHETPDIMGCSAGKTCLAIQQNGKVGFCLMHRNPIGNLNEQSFIEIFKNSGIIAMKNKLSFCHKCKHNEHCFGPCMVSGNTCSCEEERELVVNKTLMKKGS